MANISVKFNVMKLESSYHSIEKTFCHRLISIIQHVESKNIEKYQCKCDEQDENQWICVKISIILLKFKIFFWVFYIWFNRGKCLLSNDYFQYFESIEIRRQIWQKAIDPVNKMAITHNTRRDETRRRGDDDSLQ